jgi:hypothetical protein
MSKQRNDLLDLHPASVVGSLLGARPLHQSAAPVDAEPEAYEPRQSAPRRLLAAYRARRAPAARTEAEHS